jgi:hypothetical protein
MCNRKNQRVGCKLEIFHFIFEYVVINLNEVFDIHFIKLVIDPV